MNMKKTYSEINEVALDLYGASSSKKEEWVEEYEAYLHGDGNTVWNDEGFADWTEEEKKECLDIILMNYEDNTMKKKIADLIEDKVQDIFYEMQDELDIKNGCVDFGDAFELDDLQEKLAVCIEKILKFQIKIDKEEEVTE